MKNTPPSHTPNLSTGSVPFSLIASGHSVSFADVAHQTIAFDASDPSANLILQLIDTPWVQRLRRIRQTGNTYLVYMFAEHSRFGHSLGVAYLASLLMRSLSRFTPELVEPYRAAVTAAALLHDIGHVAPGSHLAERVWKIGGGSQNGHDAKALHEILSCRILKEDPVLNGILESHERGLSDKVARILSSDESLPPWTVSVISGGGWNADRGNWTVVDSTMCAVTYGRYNVLALIEAFRLTPDGELVLQESRLDALTHFYVARDSMYRQIYQHRVLQSADALTERVILRLLDLTAACIDKDAIRSLLESKRVFADDTLLGVLSSSDYGTALGLEVLFRMTESWWGYLIEQWCECDDVILRDLSLRLRDRRLFKTVRIDERKSDSSGLPSRLYDSALINSANQVAEELGLDPRYYVIESGFSDQHRGKEEIPPRVLLDNGEIAALESVEPLIAKLTERPEGRKTWLLVPKEIKEKLGRIR